jgi:hypothetical protein
MFFQAVSGIAASPPRCVLPCPIPNYPNYVPAYSFADRITASMFPSLASSTTAPTSRMNPPQELTTWMRSRQWAVTSSTVPSCRRERHVALDASDTPQNLLAQTRPVEPLELLDVHEAVRAFVQRDENQRTGLRSRTPGDPLDNDAGQSIAGLQQGVGLAEHIDQDPTGPAARVPGEVEWGQRR